MPRWHRRMHTPTVQTNASTLSSASWARITPKGAQLPRLDWNRYFSTRFLSYSYCCYFWIPFYYSRVVSVSLTVWKEKLLGISLQWDMPGFTLNGCSLPHLHLVKLLKIPLHATLFSVETVVKQKEEHQYPEKNRELSASLVTLLEKTAMKPKYSSNSPAIQTLLKNIPKHYVNYCSPFSPVFSKHLICRAIVLDNVLLRWLFLFRNRSKSQHLKATSA